MTTASSPDRKRADWQWGLELKSYGFPGQKCVIDHGAEVTAEGTRVTYRRGTGLREWFVNDQRGLEHGFTIEQRPAGAKDEEARLEFDLAVRGSLRPEISADGKTLRFEDPQGTTVLTYSGLKVSDADGKTLPARFVAEAERCAPESGRTRRALSHHGRSHRAASLSESFQHRAKVTFSALSVAISGDTVVVGGSRESSNATGVNGDQTDNSAFRAGAAYVFVRNGTTWSQQAYLKASNTDASD